jgi:hypothetical protein
MLAVPFAILPTYPCSIKTVRLFCSTVSCSGLNPLTPNDLQRRRAVSPLKIKIPTKNMCEKPTNTPIIHSVY